MTFARQAQQGCFDALVGDAAHGANSGNINFGQLYRFLRLEKIADWDIEDVAGLEQPRSAQLVRALLILLHLLKCDTEFRCERLL